MNKREATAKLTSEEFWTNTPTTNELQALIAAGADVNATIQGSNTPLLHVVTTLEELRLLIKAGANVNSANEDGITPLHLFAADYGSTEFVDLLWQRDSAWDYSEAVKLLIDNKADVNTVNNIGWTPLHYAAKHGTVEVVTLLIEQGADINALDKWGFTPLRLAIKSDVKQVLIDAGANIFP